MNSHAKVLFFATLREKTGVREIQVEFQPETNIAGIKKLLLELYPNLKPNMETIIVAMNHEFAFDENPVADGAEIALFPPVSGGEEYPTIIKLVDHAINIDQLLEDITLSSTGAACIFSGVVRGVTTRRSPHQTDELEYEAYRVMAEVKMKQIAGEIRSRWMEVEGIAIVQRLGILKPGTVSVIIACASSHRDTGIFEAARFGIDRLKEIVPIWKKEV
ncbi:MAG: molybdopterin converting factor subunit 1, partial [Acidobacteriaceae bacterium]